MSAPKERTRTGVHWWPQMTTTDVADRFAAHHRRGFGKPEDCDDEHVRDHLCGGNAKARPVGPTPRDWETAAASQERALRECGFRLLGGVDVGRCAVRAADWTPTTRLGLGGILTIRRPVQDRRCCRNAVFAVASQCAWFVWWGPEFAEGLNLYRAACR